MTFLEHCEAQNAPLAMLVGDLNMERRQVPNGMWLDVCEWRDLMDAGTCSQGATPRRIDWLMASRALQHRVAATQLSWTTGLTTHAWQAVDIVIGSPGQ